MPLLGIRRLRLNATGIRFLHSVAPQQDHDGDLQRLDRKGMQAFLRACGEARDLEEGKRAQAFLKRNGGWGDTFFMNHLIEMYGKCRSVRGARLAFESMAQPNLYSWTILITAYAQNGYYKEALGLFRRMSFEGVQPDKVAFTKAIAACCSLGALSDGKTIHACAAEGGVVDVVLETTLISLYGNCGRIEDAKRVFDGVAQMNPVCWTAMITAYARHGHFVEAIELFWKWLLRGLPPDYVTFVSTVDSCTGLGDLTQGEAVHAKIKEHGFESNAIVCSAMVNMYVKCGDLQKANDVFESIKLKTVIPWTVMISAYAQKGYSNEAVALLQRMDMEGVLPNEITFIGILDGFASGSALPQGKLIHACLVENGLISSVKANTAVLNMYGRCGSVENARLVFESMDHRTPISWSAMVAAYAQNGYVNQALEIFQEMDLAGISKTSVSFLTILSACNNAGLLREALRYLFSMKEDHAIAPGARHYSCLVDLLGKLGRLEEAEKIITRLIDKPDAAVWRSLLSACKIHGDADRAGRIGEYLKKLQPTSSSPYVNLATSILQHKNLQQPQEIG